MWKIFDRADTDSVGEMEEFVRSHEKGHFTQMPSWGDVKTFWDWRGIGVFQQERLVAAMGVLIRPLPLGFSLLYAPRGPVCDRNDPLVWAELMDALKRLAKARRGLLLHIDPDEPDTNEAFRCLMGSLGFQETSDDGFGNIQPQYVFRLDLASKDKDEIFKAFSVKTRYNIGLAQRKGVSVRECSGAQEIPDRMLEHFYALMEITGQRDHFYIRGASYFRGLLTALGDDARIFVAYLQGKPIAGAIEVFCGQKAWYLYGASSNEHRNTMPNYLLQWTMIQRAMERGCRIYDFRGVPGNPSENDPLYGLYRFKKGYSGNYTKFTGLFTYRFRPMLCRLMEGAMKLRKMFRAKTRK